MDLSGLKKFISVLLMPVLVFTSSSCSSRRSDFPSIPTPVTETSVSETEVLPDTEPSELTKLSVALPYDSDTVSRLYRLYVAKKNGYWDDSLTGKTVELSYLDSIKSDVLVENIYVPNEGVSLENLKSWGDDAPDIFLTSDLKGTIDADLCLGLDDILYGNRSFNGDSFFVSSLSPLCRNGELYGIPYYGSIPLIYGNMDFAPSSGNLDFRCSLSSLENYMKRIAQEHDGVVTFNKGYQLLPYIVSAFNEENTVDSFMLRDEYSADPVEAQNICNDACDHLAQLYEDKLTANATEDGADPVISRQSALWIAPSSELELWNSYYPNKLYFAQVPVSLNEDTSVPFLTLYPLCISKSSKVPSEAADFATFLALDKDALLLADRLEHKSGFLPLTTSEAVWDEIINDDVFGYVASVYKTRMVNAGFSFKVLDNSLSDKTDLMLYDCFDGTSDGGKLNLEKLYG